MASLPAQPVVALSERPAASPLRVAATANGWNMIPTGPWGPTLKSILRQGASLAVMELDHLTEDTARLCQALRHHWRPVRVVAFTPWHSTELERRARAAGLDAYLPAEDPDTICHTVSAILAPQTAPPVPTALRPGPQQAGIPPGSGLYHLARAGPHRHQGHDP